MPIFEYQCHQCEKVTEKIQSKPLADIPCPLCATPAVRRISRTALSRSGSPCRPNSGTGFT
ncbi:MAG: hypothetical protein K0A94_05195 [Desulfuromonadales bacterium]|nr:hypothetical protein [Desulfuromonadales bacterium]